MSSPEEIVHRFLHFKGDSEALAVILEELKIIGKLSDEERLRLLAPLADQLMPGRLARTVTLKPLIAILGIQGANHGDCIRPIAEQLLAAFCAWETRAQLLERGVDGGGAKFSSGMIANVLTLTNDALAKKRALELIAGSDDDIHRLQVQKRLNVRET